MANTEKFKDLKELVRQLEKAEDKDEMVKILQEMGEILLNNYEICIDGTMTIEPFLVEAYYYDRKKFPDTSVHSSAYEPGCKRKVAAQAFRRQRNNFGKLYVHQPKFDGIDICLSMSEKYCLSFLIKNAKVNGEWKTQMGIGHALCDSCGKCTAVEECVHDSKTVLHRRTEPKNMTAVFLPRKGVKGSYENEYLGALLIEQLKEKGYTLPTRHGKGQIAEEYLESNIAPEDRYEYSYRLLGSHITKYLKK